MSLARDWIKAALDAKLSQNELRVFLVALHQTLCYGKTSDPLTLKRISEMASIRPDRATTALLSVQTKGIVEVADHAVFQNELFIPDAILGDYRDDGFFVPALPKNGDGFRFSRSDSETRAHTTNTFTTNNLTTTTSEGVDKSVSGDSADGVRSGGVACAEDKEGLPYPDSFGTEGRKRAADILDGLPPNDARDCLLLLQAALKRGLVRSSPLGYLNGLAKSARDGALDRSPLMIGRNPHEVDEAEKQRVERRVDNPAARARWLIDASKLAGYSLDDGARILNAMDVLPLAREMAGGAR